MEVVRLLAKGGLCGAGPTQFFCNQFEVRIETIGDPTSSVCFVIPKKNVLTHPTRSRDAKGVEIAVAFRADEDQVSHRHVMFAKLLIIPP